MLLLFNDILFERVVCFAKIMRIVTPTMRIVTPIMRIVTPTIRIILPKSLVFLLSLWVNIVPLKKF
jgi:hypothetical protein